MDLETVTLSEVSDKERSYDITYMCLLKKWFKWTYLQNRNRVTDVENQLVVGRKVGRDKLGDWSWHIHTTIYKIDNEEEHTE